MKNTAKKTIIYFRDLDYFRLVAGQPDELYSREEVLITTEALKRYNMANIEFNTALEATIKTLQRK